MHSGYSKRMIEVGRARPGGVATEDDAFEHLVRIEFHLHAVDERARLAFVGVDAEIDGAWMVLGQERPFHAGGKARAAAAAQPALLDQLDNVAGRHFLQRRRSP